MRFESILKIISSLDKKGNMIKLLMKDNHNKQERIEDLEKSNKELNDMIISLLGECLRLGSSKGAKGMADYRNDKKD